MKENVLFFFVKVYSSFFRYGNTPISTRMGMGRAPGVGRDRKDGQGHEGREG